MQRVAHCILCRIRPGIPLSFFGLTSWMSFRRNDFCYDLNPGAGQESLSLGISPLIQTCNRLGQPLREGENRHELIQIEKRQFHE